MIPRLVRNVSLSACLNYVLTIVDHVYGAVAFDTPLRHHAAFLGPNRFPSVLFHTSTGSISVHFGSQRSLLSWRGSLADTTS